MGPGAREKKHRLPREFYLGTVSAAFTLCLKEAVAAGFSLRDLEVVEVFSEMLASAAASENCIVPVYCFMPDHQHFIVTGENDHSDLWKVVARYKQKTGFWLSMNRPEAKWQKDFYDHLIRSNRGITAQVKYILDNPVRKGLVVSWEDYSFKGSIGCKLDDVLIGII